MLSEQPTRHGRGRSRSGRSVIARLGAATAAALCAALAFAAPSAAADDSWTLNGSGWGHGVGMSQYGAQAMATEGKTAAQILKHYYTGTTYDAVKDTAKVSVNLVENATSATMKTSALSSGGGAVSVSDGTTTMTGALGAKLVAEAPKGDTAVTITCPTCTPVTSVSAPRLTMTWDDNRTLLSVGGRSYRDGTISVTRSGSAARVNVVAQVRIHDEYLDYITEMPWSWHTEALRAQAAAARGYVLVAVARGIRADCDCHVRNTTSDQVYAGYPSSGNLPSWRRWTAAVRATGSTSTGYVVRHKGSIIQAFYSSSTGGRTQNNEDVWAGPPLPYLRSVKDPWSQTTLNPRRAWTASVDGATMASAFGLLDVARLDLSKRHTSLGVAQATATSAAGVTSTLSGTRLRAALGLNSSYVQRKSSRLGGANRYAVAASVASRIPVGATTVVIASGEPKALHETALAGPLAGATGGPLLLSRKSGLPAETLAELGRRKGSLRTAYIVGPSSVLGTKVGSQLKARGLTVIRLSGSNRYATSRVVAAEIAKLTKVRRVAVVSVSGPSNLVSVSGAAAALGMPILLTPSTTLSTDAAASLKALKPAQAYIIGNGVTGKAEQGVRARVKTVTRVTGRTRYDISAAVALRFATAIPGHDRVVISSGLDADLITAVVAGSLKQPLLLVKPTSLPAAAREATQRLPKAGIVTTVGSTTTVSDAVAIAVRRS